MKTAEMSEAMNEAARESAEEVSVLLVDDEPDITDALGELLRLNGYRVRVAHTGEAALAAVAAQMPMCAIIDLGLPGIGGVELIRRLRAQYGAALVLLVVTGQPGVDSGHDESEAAGADYVMAKPLDFERLSQILPPLK